MYVMFNKGSNSTENRVFEMCNYFLLDFEILTILLLRLIIADTVYNPIQSINQSIVQKQKNIYIFDWFAGFSVTAEIFLFTGYKSHVVEDKLCVKYWMILYVLFAFETIHSYS